jgi:hypothetical protein
MVAVARIAFQIFVGAISKRHRGARQDVLNPLVEPDCSCSAAWSAFSIAARMQPTRDRSVSASRSRLKNLDPPGDA